jgi:dihydroxy-acid dehydratase
VKAGDVVIIRYEGPKGGPIALVKEGDSVTIDARKRLIQLNVSKAELARRKSKWKQPKPKYTTGVLAKYATLVRDASHGAVTD